MSQQPPPPPSDGPTDGPTDGPPGGYGGPPGGYGGPPGPYPPYPYQAPLGQQPPGMSNTAKFWIGVALAIPALIVGGIITGAGSAVATGVGAGSEVGSLVSSILGLGVFAGFIAALVIERTRWFAIGIMAGTAVLFILAAGACVVLLVGLSQGFS